MNGTPDLLAALEDIERLAKHTQLNIAAGLATTGVTALRRIEEKAQDARRWATVDTDQKQATA